MEQGSKDPRLVELEFLSILDAKDDQHVISLQGTEPLIKQLGISQRRLREFLFHMLMEGFINGPAAENSPNAEDFVDSRAYIVRDAHELLKNYRVYASINFKGRQRLWALRDELTSLRKLEDFQILYAKEHAKRDWAIRSAFLKDGDPISLITCDLDHFKSVNDTFGHGIGDDALKTYLRTVKDTVGDFGEAYRMGGDEVSVILPGLSLDKAKDMGESIRKNVESEMKGMAQLETLKSKPTTSVGVATFFGKVPAEGAFEKADKLAYESKTGGRNRVTAREFN